MVANKGLANRVFAVFYRHYGVVKLGIKLDEFCDIIVQGGCIVKLYMPRGLRMQMNRLYKCRNPFNFQVLDEYAEMTYAKHKIKVVITRDADIADDLKVLFAKY